MIDEDIDFQAESDAHVLIRAKEIEKDSSRVAAAREYATKQKARFAHMEDALPGTKKTNKINNGVRNSKMER